ncbi:MAG: hypothetical protein ACSHXY_12970 [Alphaproteobacteria bacterium]
MTDIVYEPKPSFDIGRIFNRTFRSIRHNFGPFLLASFLIVGIPQFLIGLWPLMLGITGSDFAPDDILKMLPVFMLVGMGGTLIVFVFQFILQGTIIHASIANFNGQHVSFRESFRAALKHIWPLIGFGILATLGMMLGFLLFIVPGIIFAIMWSVGVPAMITEGTNVSQSFNRSSELTSGYKWWIFLLIVIFSILSGIVSAVGSVIMASFGGDLSQVIVSGGELTNAYWFVNAVVTALIQVFSTMIAAAGAAALYYELRFIKEGIGPQTIADVFD